MRWRQMIACLWAVVVLSACGTDGDTVGDEGQVGYVQGFLGGVSADEPRAAIVGRDVLSSGGRAADAAVAMYFALSVTTPSAASLGGGGVCLVHDPGSETTEAIEFFAKAPAEIPPGATRPSAVPGNPRGFFALHSKYGKLRWESLLAPATTMARFGTPVSRATAVNLAVAGDALADDVGMVKVFGRSGGGMIREGETLTQVDLSVILSRMVTLGPGDFYAGQTARLLVAGAIAAGGSLSLEDLRSYRPRWRETVKFPFGNHLVHVPPPPAAAGTVAGIMLSYLVDADRFANADEAERAHLLAETAARAYGDRSRWLLADGGSSLGESELGELDRFLADMDGYSKDRHTATGDLPSMPLARPENPAATSFVAVDRFGGAVTCALTMNNLFGAGRIAPDTGIVLATVPGAAGRGPMSLSPMLVVNPNSQNFFWASASSGGVAAPTAMVGVAARVLLAGNNLGEALSAKRIHHGGLPDTTYVEQGVGAGIVSSLRDRGHSLSEARQIGRVNAFACPAGLLTESERCQIFTDPRGFGLSLASDG